MKFPSIKNLAKVLSTEKTVLDPRVEELEVRLQVCEGGWAIRTGDSSYDQDHTGFWGSGILDRKTKCRELAKDLLEEAKDHHAVSSLTTGG